MFFIAVAILSYLPLSPKDPNWNTLTLIAFIILMSANQVIIDNKRRIMDKKANNELVYFYSYGYMIYG